MGDNFRIISNDKSITNSNPSIDTIGGKAYGLHRLDKNGFDIPKTAVIPVNQIYDSIIFKEVIEFTNEVLAKDPNTLFSIRSSGCMEDSEKTSFAGMYETFLNVKYQDIDEAIKNCYSSVYSNRVSEYKSSMNIISDKIKKMAIIIQPMVKSEKSGVLFTLNPINCNKSEIVIETIKGIGERLVSGKVTPFFYCINKETGELINYEPGDELGGELENDLFKKLYNAAINIEKCFQCGMDIEFSIFKNNIIYLQARNITNLS